MDISQRDDLPSEEARQCLVEAQTLADEGRLGGAAQKCERALELSPNWAEAHQLYAAVLEEMGFVAKARVAYERASRPDAVSYDVLASREQPERRPSSLARSGASTMQIEPDSGARRLLEKARSAWDSGKLGSALRTCDAALTRVPDWPEAHNLRGLILDDMGHAEEAIGAYMEALRLAPSFDDARRNLLRAGDALEDDGNFTGLVVLRTFSFPSEAEIARGRLEAEGIPAVVLQGEIVAMNWIFSPGVGWVKLCVRQEDAARAAVALDQDLARPEPEMRCPGCGSADVHYQKYNLRGVYASILALKIPLPVRKDRWVCRRCGANWNEEKA